MPQDLKPHVLDVEAEMVQPQPSTDIRLEIQTQPTSTQNLQPSPHDRPVLHAPTITPKPEFYGGAKSIELSGTSIDREKEAKNKLLKLLQEGNIDEAWVIIRESGGADRSPELKFIIEIQRVF